MKNEQPQTVGQQLTEAANRLIAAGERLQREIEEQLARARTRIDRIEHMIDTGDAQ